MIDSKLFKNLAECLGWKINSHNEFQLGAHEDVLNFFGFLNIDVTDDVINLEKSAQEKCTGWEFKKITLTEKIILAKELDLLIPNFGAEIQLSKDITAFNAVYVNFMHSN